MENKIKNGNEEEFKPHGALAFFVLLLLLAGLIWFGVYFLMLQRA
jgi:hypothetical protein